MDKKYHLILLFIWLDYGPHFCAGQVFSRKLSWKEAMVFCFKQGGRPAAYADLKSNKDNGTDVEHGVWTADIAIQVDSQNRNKSVLSECGYIIIQTDEIPVLDTSFGTYLTNFTARGGQYYDECTLRRPYICSDGDDSTIFLINKTSLDANNLCLNQSMTLGKNISRTGQIWFMLALKDPSNKSYQVWTNEARTLKLLTSKDHVDEEQIEKVGVYHNGSFHLDHMITETKLRSVCLFEKENNRASTNPDETRGDEVNDKRFSKFVLILTPPLFIIFAALLSSLVACYVVGRTRPDEVNPTLAQVSPQEADPAIVDVAHTNNSLDSVEFRENIAEYEIGKAARRSISNPTVFYDAAYGRTAVINPNTVEDYVYDNKEFANPSHLQQEGSLYYRANFQDGEQLYD